MKCVLRKSKCSTGLFDIVFIQMGPMGVVMYSEKDLNGGKSSTNCRKQQ